MADPICVGTKDAGAMIGVCDKVVRQWIDDGLLPTVRFPSVKYPGKPGKRILILVEDLRAFAAAHRVGER